jgi:hypothetical protein
MVNLKLQIVTFVEVQQDDGYGTWTAAIHDSGFLDGYCADYDGFITSDLFASLSALNDGYYSEAFRRPLPMDLSSELIYKFNMLRSLGPQIFYWLTLAEIKAFNWDNVIKGSVTTFREVAVDFLETYVPAMEALGPDDKVRFYMLKY